MTKFARLVFEEEISEDTIPEVIVDKMKKAIQEYLKFMEDKPIKAIEDIEISVIPYEKQFHRIP